MAFAAIKLLPKDIEAPYQIFSMIDARRMEVFGAIYNAACNPILPEQAIVLDESKWQQLIQQPTICIGNGITKTKDFKVAQNVLYHDTLYTSKELVEMAMIKWNAGQFEDLAYVGPNYLKEVYIVPSK